jgi:hypothetical protein
MLMDGIEEVEVPQRFRPVLDSIVARIAQGDYDGVWQEYYPYAATSVGDLGRWVRDYPSRIVPLPAPAWDDMRCIHFEGTQEWEAYIDLWSEAGKTNLTLLVDLSDTDGELEVGVRDLRPM